MKISHTSTPEQNQKEAIIKLWNAEYPEKLIFKEDRELDAYLSDLADQAHYFAINDNNDIVGWAFTFERDKEAWFAIIVSGAHQNQGIGELLLNTLKANHPILNGWVIDHIYDLKADGSDYISPLSFYRKNDFKVLSTTRLENDKISAVKVTWHK